MKKPAEKGFPRVPQDTQVTRIPKIRRCFAIKAVTRILSSLLCATSGQEIEQLERSFGSIYPLFIVKVAWGNPQPPVLTDSPDI